MKEWFICPECNGAGCKTKHHSSGNPALETDVRCGRCYGEGEVFEEPEGEDEE